MKKKFDIKRLILLNFPYVIAFYFMDKVAAVFRLAPGTELIDKLTGGFASFGTAFANPLPSFHPVDLLVGVAAGALLKLNGQITSLNLKLSALSKKRTRLYEDFAEGVLDEEEYSFAKKSYDEQYADLSRRLDEAVQRRSKFSEAMSVDNKWITLMKSVSTATRLTQDLVDESIELVKVHENGAIELIMKYGDLYALTLQSIKEVQEAM